MAPQEEFFGGFVGFLAYNNIIHNVMKGNFLVYARF